MTFRIIERLARKIENLFGIITSPSRIFSDPLENTDIISEMAPCPQCGEVPITSYACGEYFVFSISDSTGACFCSRFTEMHASKKSEVKAWNKAVSKYLRSSEDDR